MKVQPKSIKRLAERVRKFLSSRNLTVYQLGHSIGYKNYDKLDAVIFRGTGTFTANTVEKIEEFIDTFDKKYKVSEKGRITAK